MAEVNPKYPNQMAQDEHDNSSAPYTKRVILYGWDPVNLQKVRISVNDDGSLIIGSATSAYKISDSDDSSDPAYYGYVNSTGGWYILKITASTGAYRYVKGASSYTTAWTNRASQTYNTYDNIF